jgi:L-ascorbate oxidase
MYNGQVVVDEAAEQRAAAQGNYFDSTTGAYLLEVGDVVEVVLQNQVGSNGVVIHPFHMHGGDFWDMGGGDGVFSEEAYQAILQEVDPVKRDTTLLSAIPNTRGSTGNPQGWRVWRWEAKNRGAWMLHWYVLS